MIGRAIARKHSIVAAICLAAIPIVLVGACSSTPSTPTEPGASGPSGTPVVYCGLVTVAELTSIFGQQMRPNDTGNRTCTWTATGGLPSINLRFQPDDLGKARSQLENPANVTVSGKSGVIGALSGLILYVQHGSEDLVIQSVLLNDSIGNRSKLVAVAQKALSRLP